MTTAFALLLAWATTQVTDGVRFDHLETGFQLTVPREWKMTKTKNYHRFTIPITGTDRSATLDIFGVVFTGDIPTWQAVQTNSAKQNKRELVRQWQEEILTVPMLMSRTKWELKNGVVRSTEAGLIYADTRRKFLWLAEMNEQDFDAVSLQVRNVLQTIATEDGKLPKAFDPTTPRSEDLRKPDRPEKRTTWKQPDPGEKAPVKGDKMFETTAGNIPVILRYAGDWTLKTEDGVVTATHSGVTGGVKLRAYNAAENDPPGRMLLKQSGQALSLFDKVLKREEYGPERSTSGGQIMSIWRAGTAKEGAFHAFDVVGATGDYFWLLGWTSSDAKTALSQRDLVAKFAQSLSIEPKPAGQ